MAVNEELNKQYKEQLKSVQALERFTKNITSEQKRQLKAEKAKLATIEKRIEAEEAYFDSFGEFSRKYQRLGKEVQGQIKSGKTLIGIGQQIADEKKREVRYADSTTKNGKIQRTNVKDRLSILGDISDNAIQQAKATQAAEDSLRGTTQLQKDLRDLEAVGLASKNNGYGLTKQQYALAKAQIIQTDKLKQKEERLNYLAEERKGIFNALPGPIQDMANGAQRFGKALAAGAGPIVIIGAVLLAALKSFADLDTSARAFRDTTGMTNSQMEGIKDQANNLTGQFASAGVNAEKVFNTVAALKSEFSDITSFGDEVVASITLLNTNFGVSAESAAKVQGVFEQIGGLSSETAASVQMQVAQMANLAGVAPAKVFEDIAENADIASTLFKGDVESLTKAAIEARRLGTNLKSVASTTEHLLDFQSNIGDELVAATFVGGQFSLTQARSLAAAGKTVEAQKEVLKQLERGGKFRDKDYFTQQQLAKAAGMSVEEINKQLNAQEKLNSLSSEQRALADEAISQGLDISDINKEQLASQVNQFTKQKEMKGQVEALSAAFTGIAATVGSTLTPLLQALMPVLSVILTPIELAAKAFKTIVDYIKESIPLMSALGAGAATYLILKQQSLAADKQSAIFTLAKSAYEASYNAVVMVGNTIKKKGLLTAIAEMAMRAYTSIAAIPFIGPVLGVAAAAGALALGYTYYQQAGDVMSPADGKTRISTKEGGLLELSPNDDLLAGPGIASPTKGGGGVMSGASEEKMNELIAAVKETKEVYMDGRRVTSRVASSVEKSTKNQYGFGT